MGNDEELIKFNHLDLSKSVVQYSGVKRNNIPTHHEIMQHIGTCIDNVEELVYCFQDIVGHKGPLTQNDHSYQGSVYN